MKFTFEEQSVEFDIAKLGLHEGLAIQELTGWRMKQFGEAVTEMDMLALSALGFVILKFRMGHTDLKFDEIKSGVVHLDVSMFAKSDEPDPPTEPEQSAT